MSETLAAVQERTFARATEATAASYPSEHRLTGDQLAVYLDRRDFAVVGSTRADGRPHAAMSSYFRRDGTFWLPTVGGSVRERNIRAQPWTSMVVTEGDHDQHIVVVIEGANPDHRSSRRTARDLPSHVKRLGRSVASAPNRTTTVLRRFRRTLIADKRPMAPSDHPSAPPS